MKRQAERELSPSRALLKRARDRERERAGDRDRERDRERGGLLPRPGSALPKTKAEAPGGSRSASGLEYKTLLISNLGAQVSDEHVEDGLFHEFKKFGDVSVKLSHTPELGRIAYVNFRQTESAREARHAKPRLVLYDRALKVEPMYVRRRSPTPPDPPLAVAAAAAAAYVHAHAHAAFSYRQRSLSPGPAGARDARARHYVEALTLRERERVLDYYAALEERARAYPYPGPAAEDELMPEDDQRATRNLFIGNLDHNVSEAELRLGFDKYGVIEEVVIKRPARGQGCAYAFLKFQNLDMAHRAKVAMQGRVFGGNQVKIGYGKANPTTRLWVGGLGPSTSLAALAREFDRFGSIRTVDYVKGDNFAYVHYESLDAAQAACTQMRGFPLGGPNRRLRVDFAKAAEDPRAYAPPYPPAQLPAHYEILADGYHRGPDREIRVRPRSPSHPLFTERERPPERDWSPPKGAERRPAEAFGRPRSRERHPKGSEERRKRRSRTRSPSPAEASEDRGRTRVRPGRPPTPDDSPGRVRGRLPDSTSDARDHTPDGGRNSGDDARNHRRNDPEPDSRSEKPRPEPRRPASLSEYARTLGRVWHGSLVLKNSLFPTSLHLLGGGANFFLSLLAEGARVSQLKIAQRLRLDRPKLDEVTRRIGLGGADGHTVLLAVQGPMDRASPPPDGLQRRLLRNLVTYLRSKQAAGVIGLPLGGSKGGGPGGMLYAFPPCEFSQQFLRDVLKTLGKIEEEYLVVVVVRDTAQA